MSSGPSLLHDSLPHTLNVIVHVTFGTAALIAGLIPLITTKGADGTFASVAGFSPAWEE